MIKKGIIFFSIFTISILFSKLSAQIIKGEVISGVNLSQVDGDMFYGFKKFGLNVGVGAMIPFGKNWDVSFEILYNQKGKELLYFTSTNITIRLVQ